MGWCRGVVRRLTRASDHERQWRVDLGLVHRVVDAGALDDLVEETARHIATLAPMSLRAAKAAVDGATGAAELADACFHSEDFAEGIAAFGEKRPPRFQNR